MSECLNLEDELDRRFDVAWRHGLHGLPPAQQPGALVIGHVAESVVELFLVERGYVPVTHHPGPGRHGVDLIVLHLEHEMVFAVEVKARCVPSGASPDARRA